MNAAATPVCKNPGSLPTPVSRMLRSFAIVLLGTICLSGCGGSSSSGGQGVNPPLTPQPPQLQPPAITSAATASGQVGGAFTYQIVATNSPTQYALSGTPIPGLAVNTASGLISGVPTEAGTYSVMVAASNAAGTGSKAVEVTIAPASPQACSQTLNAGANVGAAISGAAAGAILCLANGDYAGFTLNNVVKSPRVTIRAVNPRGANFTGTVGIRGNTNGLTFEGINYSGIDITGADVANLTFRNGDASRGAIRIDGVNTAVPEILFENLAHINQDSSGSCRGAPYPCIGTAGYHFNYAGRSSPVATIRGAYIDGGCADGVQSGVPFVLEYSIIKNKRVGSCPNDPHTDATQFYGGPFAGTVVRGNYYFNNDQVIGAYDGIDGVLFEHNLFDPGVAGRPCQIELYADKGSVVRNNTIVARGSNGYICLDRKSSFPPGVDTQVYNNIALGLSIGNGSTASLHTKNLYPAGGGTNLPGSPTFVGACGGDIGAGASWMQCALAGGSAGKNAGTDGRDVGIHHFGSSTAAACAARAYTPGGSDGGGGCFPGPDTTGVPSGTSLTAYTGPCTITAANAVIDAKVVNCSLSIRATGVAISRSVINGTVYADPDTSASFSIIDSQVDVGNGPGTGIGDGNFTALRVHVTGGNRSANCFRNCTVESSYVHGQFRDATGTYHESGIRMGSGSVIRGNSIACDAPDVPPDAGCSAAITGYGDFAVVQDNVIDGNLIIAESGGYCAYGGSSPGKPYSNGVNKIRYTNNVWQKGPSGKCGVWGPITSFDINAPGNVWSNNRFDDGAAVQPAN